MPQSKSATVPVIEFNKEIKASDTIRLSSDADTGNINPDTYTKYKELTLTVACASIRVSFHLYAFNGCAAYGRIYKNGVAIGTERTQNSNTNSTWTQDFTNLVIGDKIQLYARTAVLNNSAHASEFRICYDKYMNIVKDSVNQATNMLVTITD